jgi:hypothetical protein
MNLAIQKKNVVNAGLILCIVSTIVMYAKEEGIVGRTKKNRKGCTCHNEVPSNDVLVSISGPDSLQVGQSAVYTVTISGASIKAAGTNIAASDGELLPVSRDLKKLKGELTHTSPKYSSSGKTTFQFTYTAPIITGEQNLYASGNAVNLNGKKTGDSWNHAPTKLITIINSSLTSN